MEHIMKNKTKTFEVIFFTLYMGVVIYSVSLNF